MVPPTVVSVQLVPITPMAMVRCIELMNGRWLLVKNQLIFVRGGTTLFLGIELLHHMNILVISNEYLINLPLIFRDIPIISTILRRMPHDFMMTYDEITVLNGQITTFNPKKKMGPLN